MTAVTTHFITGANRGIGFELVKKYSDEGAKNLIIATARNVEKAVELQALADKNKNVQIIQLDVADSESIATLDSRVAKITDGIDVFISNGAIADSFYGVLEAKKKVWEDHYYTNALGPILVYQQLHKYLLKRSTRKVIFISTLAASITGFFPASASAYGQSKAALNYSVKELSFELKGDNFIVVAVHPGAVSTDMGNAGLAIIKKNNPEISAAIDDMIITSDVSSAGLKKVFDGLKEEQNGLFLNFDGSELPF
ncbi:uncharacterized protein RJT20DRAFT_142928 [Scheffersomyces xylosifermentans]|uniref:uncharacterized protein n=1 Tax=Scheffersomyces xylosifermentans TaxID=1304137 RepID=UPI00315DEEA1